MDDKTKGIKLFAGEVKRLSLDHVHRNPKQPRQVFSEEGLRKLAANILAFKTMIYAVIVRTHPTIKGHYEIVAGERRWRALKLIGVEEFYFHFTDEEVPSYLISLIENDNREDLNPIDEAEAFQKCMEEEDMSVMELAKFTGKHYNDIYRALRLLKLPGEVRELIRQGKLRGGQAHNLVQFRNYAKQIEFARKLIAGEDPPELDEQMSRTSARGDAIVESRLPTSVAGLIRRMLRFRRDSNSVKFVIKAYLLSHSIGERIEGWCSFTEETRSNFVSELEKLVALLQDLLKQIKEMPETKRRPGGAAAIAVARKEAVKASSEKTVTAAPKREEKSVAAKKPTGDSEVDKLMALMSGGGSTIKREPARAATELLSGLDKKPESPMKKYNHIFRDAKGPPAAPRHTGTQLPPSAQPAVAADNAVSVPADPKAAAAAMGGAVAQTAQQEKADRVDVDAGNPQIVKDRNLPYAATATKITVHILGQVNESGRNFLGREILALRLGNGSLQNQADVDKPVAESLRYIRAHWNSVPARGDGELNEFLGVFHKLKVELRKRGCTDFDGFISMLKARDNSPDPIGLGGF